MQGPGAAERPRFNPYKNSLRHYVLILHTGKRSCRDVRYLPKDTASKRELGLRLDVRDRVSSPVHCRLLTEVLPGADGDGSPARQTAHCAGEKQLVFV